jgi:hypothetical protein
MTQSMNAILTTDAGASLTYVDDKPKFYDNRLKILILFLISGAETGSPDDLDFDHQPVIGAFLGH